MNVQRSPAPRLARLSAEHRGLDRAIRTEARRDAPDFFRLGLLKKRKLALRDTLALRSRINGAGPGTKSA